MLRWRRNSPDLVREGGSLCRATSRSLDELRTGGPLRNNWCGVGGTGGRRSDSVDVLRDGGVGGGHRLWQSLKVLCEGADGRGNCSLHAISGDSRSDVLLP